MFALLTDAGILTGFIGVWLFLWDHNNAHVPMLLGVGLVFTLLGAYLGGY